MDILRTIPTHMDFDGQGRAEKYSRFIITLFGVVGLLWGYIIQQFSQTVYILGAGFVLAALALHDLYCKQPQFGFILVYISVSYMLTTKLDVCQKRAATGFYVVPFLTMFSYLYATFNLSQHHKEVTIPPWPMYRRKSLQWQKPRTDSDFHNESTGKSKKKK